jgi:3-oxoacid CoA-transferase subunit A/glutaconate CoA-transferase subunit A
MVEDFELARAARRLIVTTEEVVSEEIIRDHPDQTKIPGFIVDAVVEVKYGAHPTLMPELYYFDEEIIGEWLDASKTDEGTAEWIDKYIRGTSNFQEYIELVGGETKMEYLRAVEHYEAELKAPWLDKKRK